MKLTTKILKEMIRKELKESRDPFGKKGSYYSRNMLSDPEEEEKQKAIAIEKIIETIMYYDDRFGEDLDPELNDNDVEVLRNITDDALVDFKDDEVLEMWIEAYDKSLDMM